MIRPERLILLSRLCCQRSNFTRQMTISSASGGEQLFCRPNYSVGTTSRPLYVPQVGHTRCRIRGLWHCGQRASGFAGRPKWAVRPPFRFLECFFLGSGGISNLFGFDECQFAIEFMRSLRIAPITLRRFLKRTLAGNPIGGHVSQCCTGRRIRLGFRRT